MPFITVEMIEGRTEEQKRELVQRITDVICETVDVTPDKVYVFLEDLKKDNFAKAGKLLMELSQLNFDLIKLKNYCI